MLPGVYHIYGGLWCGSRLVMDRCIVEICSWHDILKLSRVRCYMLVSPLETVYPFCAK
jgi:hypothetical protein